MHILLTGVCGFLGSHLCEYLLEKQHAVIGMDNLITGKMNNIVHLLERRDFQFIKQDVTDYIDVKGEIDYVLHFASPASPADYLNYPIQTLKVGSLGTHKALGLAKKKKAQFLLASSSEVYGDPHLSPQPEDYWGNVNPVGPRGVYDEAKRFAEALVMAYHRSHSIDTKIARIFNTYGPRQSMRAVIPTIITQALSRGEIKLGAVSPTRDFTYVQDTVEGFIKIAESPRSVGEIVNIGSGFEISIGDVAAKICALIGKNIPVVSEEGRKRPAKSEVNCLYAANKKAWELVGWKPRVSLDDGLKETIKWISSELEHYQPDKYYV